MSSSNNINKYNPNALHAFKIIYQFGAQPSLSIHHSHFIGSFVQLYLNIGTAKIYDCVFENSAIAIQLNQIDEAVMYDCKIKNNGQYNGLFMSDSLSDNYDTARMQIWFGNNIVLSNNIISGYDPKGLLFIYGSSNISLIHNTFTVDTTHLFYNISKTILSGEITVDFVPVTIGNSSKTRIVSNEFNTNEFDEMRPVPWILYHINYDYNCISGNTFTNYAFHSYYTNITSCSRLQLIKCAHKEYLSYWCMDGMYGNIDSSLFAQTGIFNIDASCDTCHIFSAISSDIAIDNVNIIVMNTNKTNNSNPISVSINDGNFLLIDSNISNNYDISYNSDDCNIIYNDRLNDTNWISRILMDCLPFSNNLSYSLSKTMDSSNTEIVNHLSPTKLNFTAKTSSYYPGQLLQFEYHITDTFGNIIDYNSSDGITIRLQGNKFSTYLDIEPNGKCPICESGLFINVLSISKNITDTYDMNVFIDNNIFIFEYSTISVNVIGCAVGRGPDSNNFTCIVCNTDCYNIKSNNTDLCLPCDPNNVGIKCIEGKINITQNYWMGFDGNRIISSQCPTKYCCQSKDGCNYIDTKDILCALHRDYNSILCSKCIKGYSESMRSTACVKCDKHIFFVYILYPMGFAILWTIYLILITSDSYHDNKSKYANGSIKRYLSNPYFRLMMETFWNRNIMYYEQALSQILSSTSVIIFFKRFTEVFNFSITTNTGNGDNLWCFFDGMNAKQKILIELFIPAMIILFIGILHLISKYLVNGSIVICKKRKLNFSKIYIAAFLLIIGNVLGVLFKLMNCQSVGDTSVHFYFGYESCYKSTWIASFICLISIIIIFSLVFVKLRNMTAGERQNKKHLLNTFVVKYKPQFYYWELVLFIRRISIAIFSVSVSGNTFKLIFVIVMVVFTVIQKKCEPFKVYSANEMEFLLLLALVIVIVAHLLSSVNGTFNSVITTMFILLPFVLLIYYIHIFIKKKHSDSLFLFKQRIKYLFLLIVWYYSSSNKYNYKDDNRVSELLHDDNKEKETEMITTNVTASMDYQLMQDNDGDDL